MQKYAIDDEVIVCDTSDSDTQWSYYLSGSKGVIEKVNSTGSYHCKFIEIVDAHPDVRARHNYDLDFLVRSHNISGEDLKPCTEPLITPCDNGFEFVF